MPRGKASKHLYTPSKGRRQQLAKQRFASYRRWDPSQSADRETSVQIKSELWKLAEEYEFEELRQGTAPRKGVQAEAEDLYRCGAVGV